jgi:hypothetical protein
VRRGAFEGARGRDAGLGPDRRRFLGGSSLAVRGHPSRPSGRRRAGLRARFPLVSRLPSPGRGSGMTSGP